MSFWLLSPRQPWALGIVPVVAGCGGPLSTLDPQGPVAREIAGLWWGMLAGAAGITLLVMALLAMALRGSTANAPREGFWIKGMGLGFSLSVLALVVGAGIVVGERMQPRAAADVFKVTATARQWAWRFTYDTPDGRVIASDGPLYIPAATPVDVTILTEDVIHAFWVPRLAGKMDAIPGHTNVLRLQADRPGRYDGRSAEFSGTGYAAMRFGVVVFDPADPPLFLHALTEAP